MEETPSPEDIRILMKHLGKIKTPAKNASSKANFAKAIEARRKPLADIPCRCPAGDAPTGHLKSCPRGRAIARRDKAATPTASDPTPT